MKVTRDVMNDLLPAYFSGEASKDTRTLVEEYFRENPEFEREARGAARPLESLSAAVAVAPEVEKEKRTLQSVHKEMWRRKLAFGMALFFTLAPLAFVYSKGHIKWIMFRDEPWNALFYWGFGAFLWLAYFARLTQRMFSLVAGIFLGLFPVVMHFVFPGGPRVYTRAIPNFITALFWGLAALSFLRFFLRLRQRTISLLFAIFLTAFPLATMLYSVLAGSEAISQAQPTVIWIVAAFMWFRYFWLRRKANVDKDEC